MFSRLSAALNDLYERTSRGRGRRSTERMRDFWTCRSSIHCRTPVFELLEDRRLLAIGPLGGEFRLNWSTVGDQARVALDANATGDCLAVWQSNHVENNSNNDIFFQRYNAQGSPLGREERANPDWHGDQVNPDVAVANNGSFVVTWSSGDGDSYGIFARRFAADGAPLGNVIQVNNTPDGEQGFSQVATNDATGTFVVVWASNGQDGSGWGVYGQRFAADGTKQGDEFRVNSETLYDQDHPGVAMDETGDFVVVWQSFGQEGWDLDVRAQRVCRGWRSPRGTNSGSTRMPGVPSRIL